MEMDHTLQQHQFGAHLCQEAHPHHQPAMPHFVQHPSSSSADNVKASKRFVSRSHKGEGSFYDNRKDLGGISNDHDDDCGVDSDDDEDNRDDSDEDCDEDGDHSTMELREHHQDGCDGIGIIQEGMAWHRTKWTNDMVVLLIKTVHLVGEDGSNSIIVDNPSSALASGSKRKASSLLQKKGKWRLVSMKMNEASCYVSPQQCEDKFNDLNKRYKRLNDVLGKEMALEAVGRPSLLDNVKGISPKVKEDVKKILTSKHTFYKEMHAFYNNGLEPIQKPLQSPGDEDRGVGDTKGAIRLLDENPATTTSQKQRYESENLASSQKPSYESENLASSQKQSYESGIGAEKLMDYEIAGLPVRVEQARIVESNPSLLDEPKEVVADRIFADRILELEQRKVAIQARALELERRFFRWQRQRVDRDAELEKLREENRRMKAENDRLSLLLNVQLMPNKKPQRMMMMMKKKKKMMMTMMN